MLGIVDSLQVEASSMWIDILVKAALCAIILLLQHKVKMLEKYAELRRTVDGIINARLARIVYQKDWKFTTAEAETDYMRQHFAEEKEDVRRILSDSAKHLSG
ncbi:MAG: hypothetical protein IPG10_12525, partial [Flavobacteriales bacterium]|nr:hypothetical protein [Flavobacteriales bacterium]